MALNMSLKFKYISFITVLHLILICLIYFLLKDQLWYFIGSEILVFISIFFSYLLYKSFIQPINLLKSGTDAIADKDFSIKYLKTGSTEVDKLVEVYNHMIDTLRDERIKISEQSYFIQKLIEVTPIGIIIMDYDGNISNINPSARKQLGIKIYEDVISKKLIDYPSPLSETLHTFPPGKAKVIKVNKLDKYKVQVSEIIHQGFKRKFILIDDLSTELLKTEKDAFGTIIRMMAHEVNNSMGAINSIIDSVVEFGFTDEQDTELKESLLIAKKRNVRLSQFMDNYASLLRIPDPNKKRIDLANLLKKTGQLFVPNALKRNIDITFDLPKYDLPINADPILLEQAISNMIKNAIESINDNGEIVISAIEKPIGFKISDNGPGISDNIAKNLFTPFFSTKTTGQGVGLMLIREILQSHGATFNLGTDRQSGWTEFEVYLEDSQL